MEINYWKQNDAGETAAGRQDSETPTGFENVKNVIADTLQSVADGLGDKAADSDAQSGIAQYGQQASEWLDHSAECVRQFDYKEADAMVREYVRHNPGRTLLIAGGVGLMIGVLFRRR